MDATRRGRPRSATIDEAVLAAARRQLADGGYASLSFAAVAEEAGTSRPAIYRRFATKAALAESAMASFPAEAPPAPASDPFADLVAELSDFRRGVSLPGRLSLVGTMLQSTTDPEAAARYRARVIAPRRARLRAILERAAADGLIDRRQRPRRGRDDAHRLLVRALPGRRSGTGRLAAPRRRAGLARGRRRPAGVARRLRTGSGPVVACQARWMRARPGGRVPDPVVACQTRVVQTWMGSGTAETALVEGSEGQMTLAASVTWPFELESGGVILNNPD